MLLHQHRHVGVSHRSCSQAASIPLHTAPRNFHGVSRPQVAANAPCLGNNSSSLRAAAQESGAAAAPQSACPFAGTALNPLQLPRQHHQQTSAAQDGRCCQTAMWTTCHWRKGISHGCLSLGSMASLKAAEVVPLCWSASSECVFVSASVASVLSLESRSSCSSGRAARCTAVRSRGDGAFGLERFE